MPSVLCTNRNTFEGSLTAWIENGKREEHLQCKKARVYGFEDYTVNVPVPPSISKGEKRLLEFENHLENSFPWERHLFQREFTGIAEQVLAEYIVGEDWPSVGPIICKERGWEAKSLSKIFLAQASRRLGKSMATGMMAAAIALTVPKSKQAIFSTSQRISSYLAKICHDAIFHKYPHVIKKFTEEELILDFGNNDIRCIFSYPSRVQVLMYFSLPPPPCGLLFMQSGWIGQPSCMQVGQQGTKKDINGKSFRAT